MSAGRPRWDMADVIGQFGADLDTGRALKPHIRKTLRDLANCRTALLGGHVDACTECGTLRISYNSCGNRHCGKCQGVEREAWALAREGDLLPVTYFHVVFTLPDDLNGLCLYNPRTLYTALFDAAWETLVVFARDEQHLGAEIGATMVLHTWGQTLALHPHVHAVVPGGGLTAEGRWRAVRSGSDRFLFPVKAMSRVFRAVMLKKVLPLLESGLLVVPPDMHGQTSNDYRRWRNDRYRKPWVVYAKRPFGGPKQVIEYLGRYTHKTAISNHRILDVTAATVRFAYKDYRTEGQKKEMTLAGGEFLRRFTLHILPPGFRRMRHYGILSNSRKKAALAAIRRDLQPENPLQTQPKDRKTLRAEAFKRLFGDCDPVQCPCCKALAMVRIGVVPPQRPPPAGELPRWKTAHA